tara:strand:+ start:200 stop:1099 length:900 start_codon:yes stop_codon:yes gene_type:complete
MSELKERFLADGELNFKVSKVKMHTYNVVHNDDYNETPFYAVVNDTTGEALGPVRGRYTVMQNDALLNSILDKLEPGSYDLSRSRCGHFNNGKKVFFFIKLLKNMSVNSGTINDDVDLFLYALSSHDGSQRLVYGISTMMHSCSNMFATLMADKDNNHVVKHTKKIEEQNGGFINELIKRNTDGLFNLFTIMSNNRPSDEFMYKIIDIVAKVEGKKRVVKNVLDKRKLLKESIDYEYASKGTSYYGLFNGLTHYLTHKHHEHTTWSSDYELLIGNSGAYTKKALQMIIKDMKETGVSMN